ncbi:MAG: bifunctional glutamate N-acetyltransferase/amino-acid acetyltransferase ArgJ [Coriobacteriaceae bacterium]|jgi:glutamate N-acetyltransferase/amino-acid N-acetyltransferase|nr:bifunctional glutamate N-acetyltransferase/amino-acid acetyltransferase ArgJ [Coriobacteriaceae bacterium]
MDNEAIKSATKLNPPTPYQAIEEGGVASARGFSAAGIYVGLKKKVGILDLALILADEPCPSAAVFTKSVFSAPPVIVSRKHLDGVSYGHARALLMNSGNANASTGQQGMDYVNKNLKHAAELLGCQTKEVLMASTGVIGLQMPADLLEENLERLISVASREGGNAAATAIMTTDTHPKECAVSYISHDPAFEGQEFRVGGMAKGAGMMMPDMATLLAAITTDAPLSPSLAYRALKTAVDISFNKVSVDSDTSTNDTCFFMASGKAAKDNTNFEEGSTAYLELLGALEVVCNNLARQIAADGEGATRLITVNVDGAHDALDADKAARSVANSPLVKTAIFGHDANWGRIAMALGKSGADFAQENVSINFLGLPVCHQGSPVDFDEEEMLRRFEAPEIVIDINLGAGTTSTTMWTCDLTHEYVTINGDYRT